MGIELFIGADESNNGQALEIHTAVFSAQVKDVNKTKDIMSKRRSHNNLPNRLRNRGYSFILFTESDKNRIIRNERLGVITASLLYEEFDFSEMDRINIYFDGYKCQQEIEHTQELVCDTLRLPSNRIKIIYGPKLDQYYPVVNMADQLAHYLFKKPVDYLSENKNRKELLF